MTRLILLSLSLFLAVSVAAAAPVSVPEPAAAAAANDGSAAKVSAPVEIPLLWLNEFETGMRVAAIGYQPAFVLFTGPGCSWCHKLKTQVLDDSGIKALLANFILLELNVTTDRRIAQQFQIRGIPAILILSGDGRLLQRAEGYTDVPNLRNMLQQVLNPAFVRKSDPELTAVLRLLGSAEIPDGKWPELLLAMGREQGGREVREKIAALKELPVQQLLSLLEDRRLAVRLGALELLEERMGDSFGFDPWLEPGTEEANLAALQRLREWEPEAESGARRYTALSEEQIKNYIRDLISDERQRADRAVRMLERAGRDTAARLSDFLAENQSLAAGARNRIREVQYSIMLPTVAGIEPAVFAHRLVFGNLAVRLQSLKSLGEAGSQAVPVLRDFMQDREPLIREVAADALGSIGGRAAVDIFSGHLQQEQNREVVFSIIKGLGGIRSKAGLNILKEYSSSQDEDLAIAAINSITRLKTRLAQAEIGKSLDDPRWRVRVAALEAVGSLKLKELQDKVLELLQDPDDFVRHSAVQSVIKVAGKSAAAKHLEPVFLREDSLKAAVLEAFGRLEITLPASFAPALAGKPAEVLLAVISVLHTCGTNGLELAAGFVENPDLDVACAAIRFMAEKGMGNAAYRSMILQVLKTGGPEKVLAALEAMKQEGDEYSAGFADFSFPGSEAAIAAPADAQADNVLTDLFAAFTTDPKKAAAQPAPAPENNVDDLFAAFQAAPGTGSAAAVSAGNSADWTDILEVSETIFSESNSREIRFAAAALLLKAGNPAATAYLTAGIAEWTTAQRVMIADAVKTAAAAEPAVKLLQALLNDPSATVRRRTVHSLMSQESELRSAFELLLRQLFSQDSRLKPEDLLNSHSFRSHTGRSGRLRSTVRQHIPKLLAAETEPVLQTFGLLLQSHAWSRADEKAVAPFLSAPDQFQRRAAYYALGSNSSRLFLEKIPDLAADPSEFVRLVLADVYKQSSFQVQHYLKAGIFEEEYVHRSRGSFGLGTSVALDAKARDALIQLTADRVPKVRFEAFLTLLTNRVPINLNELIDTIESFPDRHAAAREVGKFLSSNYQSLGPPFKVLLPYLERGGGGDPFSDSDSVSKVRKHFGRGAEGDDDDEQTQDLQLMSGQRKDTAVIATFLEETAVPEIPPPAEIRFVYFSSAGCGDCSKVENMLRELQRDFPLLEIETHDIRTISAMRLNEALADRFNIPDRSRLVTPAVFAGAGALSRYDITFAALSELIYRSAGVPLDSWYSISEPELAAAETAITSRYSAMGFWVVFLAGLLDGVNPCAFATIIFLLSYLQVVKRKPFEILQVGGAFILAVFLAYFFLGLGLIEVISRLQGLRYAGIVLNWAMAGLALLVMVLSIRDGILCVHGRLEDMTLQLPEFLKRRIHTVIRHGARQAHFVLAAFIAGIIISFLELACTGLVYAPTIMFMLKTGRNSAGAVFYLSVYNLAFILPLLIIFAMAYAGMRSEALTRIMKKHAASVKFATAALFLFILLVFGSRILPVLQ